MRRRQFLQAGLAAVISRPLWAAWRVSDFEAAAEILSQATQQGQVRAAVMTVQQREARFVRHFGTANSADAMFLLGSISKPICITALMTLFDRGEFQLDDPVSRYLPRFTGAGRERVTLRQVLTHVSGLPDQLADNNQLRKDHAPLAEFVRRAEQTPLSFPPGERYQYSSMGILLATHVAEVISGTGILELVDRTVLQPLKMQHSAQGLGRFQLSHMVPVQTEFAAPEAGAGDPTAKDWDWNSAYWRRLGAPWGGTHASAPDVARFLAEFLTASGTVLKPDTARLMIRNHNPPGLTPRGLGFHAGTTAAGPGCSERSFGHTGSTGTICWADPASDTICVVLTSLPGRAITPHPRELASQRIARGVN